MLYVSFLFDCHFKSRLVLCSLRLTSISWPIWVHYEPLFTSSHSNGRTQNFLWVTAPCLDQSSWPSLLVYMGGILSQNCILETVPLLVAINSEEESHLVLSQNKFWGARAWNWFCFSLLVMEGASREAKDWLDRRENIIHSPPANPFPMGLH